ncbi:MAG: NAD(P)H-dependent oxidoreductase [Candidatus Bathyarchaeota archaeon]|nr:NAD(P)H-dependent oxidoreductase [Candidatus Bathyarchaeota archaeon]
MPEFIGSLKQFLKALSDKSVTQEIRKLVKVIIIYDSQTGNTQTMAHAVAEGAREVGVEVIVKNVTQSTKNDLLDADGVILGAPTHYGLMSANMKAFIDKSEVWQELAGKIGGVFTNSAGVASGGETTLLSMIIAMFIHGMVIPGRADDMHYGVALTGNPNQEGITHCKALGRLVADWALKLNAN